jgi:hypothetical protein
VESGVRVRHARFGVVQEGPEPRRMISRVESVESVVNIADLEDTRTGERSRFEGDPHPLRCASAPILVPVGLLSRQGYAASRSFPLRPKTLLSYPITSNSSHKGVSASTGRHKTVASCQNF